MEGRKKESYHCRLGNDDDEFVALRVCDEAAGVDLQLARHRLERQSGASAETAGRGIDDLSSPP
jgi:hypothetical protein